MLTMADKYHNEWVIRDIATCARIVKSQIRSFDFLSGMAFALDNSIEMLEGIENISVMDTQIGLMKKKTLYLKMAIGIRRQIGGAV